MSLAWSGLDADSGDDSDANDTGVNDGDTNDAGTWYARADFTLHATSFQFGNFWGPIRHTPTARAPRPRIVLAPGLLELPCGLRASLLIGAGGSSELTLSSTEGDGVMDVDALEAQVQLAGLIEAAAVPPEDGAGAAAAGDDPQLIVPEGGYTIFDFFPVEILMQIVEDLDFVDVVMFGSVSKSLTGGRGILYTMYSFSNYWLTLWDGIFRGVEYEAYGARSRAQQAEVVASLRRSLAPASLPREPSDAYLRFRALYERYFAATGYRGAPPAGVDGDAPWIVHITRSMLMPRGTPMSHRLNPVVVRGLRASSLVRGGMGVDARSLDVSVTPLSGVSNGETIVSVKWVVEYPAFIDPGIGTAAVRPVLRWGARFWRHGAYTSTYATQSRRTGGFFMVVHTDRKFADVVASGAWGTPDVGFTMSVAHEGVAVLPAESQRVEELRFEDPKGRAFTPGPPLRSRTATWVATGPIPHPPPPGHFPAPEDVLNGNNNILPAVVFDTPRAEYLGFPFPVESQKRRIPYRLHFGARIIFPRGTVVFVDGYTPAAGERAGLRESVGTDVAGPRSPRHTGRTFPFDPPPPDEGGPA